MDKRIGNMVSPRPTAMPTAEPFETVLKRAQQKDAAGLMLTPEEMDALNQAFNKSGAAPRPTATPYRGVPSLEERDRDIGRYGLPELDNSAGSLSDRIRNRRP